MLRLLLIAWFAGLALATEPVQVCCTTTDLGSLMRSIGGDRVAVTVFARGGDDVHAVEPRPSFIKQLHRAELLVDVGMELEIAWLPTLVDQAANAAIRSGQPGRLTAADANRQPLGVPTGTVDRSHGDVHAAGNPHFLADPIIGWRVATLMRDRLCALRPDEKSAFTARWQEFSGQVAERLIGAPLTRLLGAEAALQLIDDGGFSARLAQPDAAAVPLGGWLAAMQAHQGTAAIADHDLWPYFARRFGIDVIGFLEPQPGLPPTSGHLARIVELAQTRGVRLIITSPFADPKPAALVAQRVGARVVVLPHQTAAMAGTDEYLDFIDACIRSIAGP